MLVSTLTTLRDLVLNLPTQFIWQSNEKRLHQAILQTIVYFDQFNFPLTEWEVYKYLWRRDLRRKFDFTEVRQALQTGLPELKSEQGFYFLQGRAELVKIRKARQNISSRKYKQTRWILKLLSCLPFIEMIAVCNSLAGDNAREESDVDLFIVATPGRIWTARFYTIIFLKIFKLRPQKENKKDKICSNFFINRDQLNIRHLMIKNDIYFMYWLRQFTPIYDRDNILADLMAQNKWLAKFVNTDYLCNPNLKRRSEPCLESQTLKSSLELINNFNFIEKLLKKFQLKIMPASLKENANQDIEVVVNSQMLKFHHGHKKEEFRDEWQRRLKIING